ncbi:MAG TPA: VPDSG-CTERM sorting domain-containing protein [Opitutus sp.]|nr:VPDSG-CTERM sorting domain-containing protein [Opitutus sp.]
MPRFSLPSLSAFTLLSLAVVARVAATPFEVNYSGDAIPSTGAYAAPFTTVGPGHPTGSYFVGTTWSSDGNVLTMETRHPSDYPGSSSMGIWFGRTDGYGDPSNFSLANTALGNQIDARLALGANSSEWSLYWYDANGFGSSFYFLNNGFSFYTQAGGTFVARSDMTSFHTFGSHVQNGQVSYYFDGTLIGSGAAVTGLSNFLLIGDGSASDVSGYGTFKIDSLSVKVEAGSAPPSVPTQNVPDSGSTLLLTATAVAGLLGLGRRVARR